MDLSTKILFSILFVLSLGTFGFLAYKQIQTLKKQEDIEKSVILQKELTDNLVRSLNVYASKKDLEDFAKENKINLQAIKDDLDKLNASLKGINKITVISNGTNNTNIPSTNTIPNTNPVNEDKYGYLKASQILDLSEDFGSIKAPIGNVRFEAWKEKPWSEQIFSREYNISTIIGQDEDNRLYTYNKFFIKINNKDYEVKINKSTFLQEFPEEKFSFWNPRFFLGISAGLNIPDTKFNFSPGFYFAPFSYGKFKSTPSFVFMQIGPSYNINSKVVGASLSPAMYNIGNNVSFVKNTYVGPSFSIDMEKRFSILATMSVGF